MPTLKLKPGALSELARYALVSASGFAIDVAVLFLLTALGLNYRLAAAIGFLSGGAAVYFLSIRYVFRFRRVANSSMEFSLFMVIGVIGMVVNVGIISLCVDALRQPLIVGKLAASAVTLLVNYLVRRLTLFTDRRVPDSSECTCSKHDA